MDQIASKGLGPGSLSPKLRFGVSSLNLDIGFKDEVLKKGLRVWECEPYIGVWGLHPKSCIGFHGLNTEKTGHMIWEYEPLFGGLGSTP